MGFAVVSCGCQNAWAVDLRNAKSRCTRCGKTADLQKRQRHWSGEDAKEARNAASAIRTALAQGRPVDEAAAALEEIRIDAGPASHDSPADAAAAKARDLRNQSDRAEAVALWLTRLLGATDDATYMDSLQKAGLSQERAEKEIVRMLACDVIYEPQAGKYAALTA